MHRFPRTAALAALGAALAAPLNAQAVRGTLAEPGGNPVAGAMVLLVDDAGTVRARALTDAAGRYLVRAPGPGTFRVRAERIGYGATTSAALALGAGETREQALRASAAPVTLAGLSTRGRGRCEVRPAEGTATAALWGEVRKALDAAVYVQSQRSMRFATVLYQRDLQLGTLEVLAERRRPVAAAGSHPFRSRSAAELARDGFVNTNPDGTFYHAPDADVLLSDEFLDGHCFRVQPGQGATAGMVGLAFMPARGRSLPDVAGTLWVDPATRELRFLEYRYVNLALPVSSDDLGGRVEFERLPDGGWIVRRWWLRMPTMAAEQVVRRVAEGMGMDVRRSTRLAGLREEGGEVTSVEGSGSPPPAARPGAVVGRLVAGGGRAPLAGARIALAGTAYAVASDTAGSFRIEGVAPGRYTLSVAHPRLDSLRVTIPTHVVEVAEGGEARVEMALAPAPAPRSAFEQPVRIAEVRATAAPTTFGGFYQRAASSNAGHFITRAEIERRRPTRLVDLFADVPAMRVQGGRVRMQARGLRLPGGVLGAAGAASDSTVRKLGTGAGTGYETQCIPTLVVDGVVERATGFRGDDDSAEDQILATLAPLNVEGIEVYPRGALAPASVRVQRSECGVIMVWTRK